MPASMLKLPAYFPFFLGGEYEDTHILPLLYSLPVLFTTTRFTSALYYAHTYIGQRLAHESVVEPRRRVEQPVAQSSSKEQ